MTELRQLMDLKNLKLDATNPRFGDSKAAQNQRQILDHIVENFGVDDLLSSLSVNGYFAAEPLVVRLDGVEGIVAEGNRRLAACLILTGDERAFSQRELTNKYKVIWAAHGSPSLDPLPVIQFDSAQTKSLLSYLGVRHIASSKSWDSYAKAAWVARVLAQEQSIGLTDVATMIGDQNKTVARLLQAYYVVNQLKSSGEFRPEDSIRKGRGTATEYPFSWVYTILGYSATRQFLELGEDPSEKMPLKASSVSKGALVLRSMFGDRSRGKNSAIDDSRQLGELASVFVNPEKLAMLESGKSVSEISRLSESTENQMHRGLFEALETLKILNSQIEAEPLLPEAASKFVDPATKVRNSATALQDKLRQQGKID